MSSPTDRRYTQTHEWIKLEGDIAIMGITRHAVDQLTDVTYVQVQPAGTTLDAGEAFGEVESVKTTSDVYTPVAGEIVEANGALDKNPGLINDDPYEGGWLVKIRINDAGTVQALPDAATYDAEHAN